MVTVLSTSGDIKAISTKDLGEPIWATPAIGEGQVIVRSEKHLWLFEAK